MRQRGEEGLVPIPIYQRAQATPEEIEEAIGAYIPDEAEGAIPNGARVVKVDRESDDGTPLAMSGYVLSSLDVREINVPGIEKDVSYFYFVKWDDFPHPVGICDWKIRKEEVR